MSDHKRRRICTIDHSNKRRELARQTPYQFWLGQVKHRGTAFSDSGEATEDTASPGVSRRNRR